MARGVHLVGAFPGASAREAMEAALGRLAPHLRTLTDGETGPRSGWIQANLNPLREHPMLELVRDGGYTSYEDTPLWRVRDGHELTADDLEPYLVQLGAFQASYPLFKRLRAEHGRPDLDFQVGFPSHLDHAVITFGEAGFSPGIYEAALEATARQVRAIHREADGDVVFQIECVIPMAGVGGAPEPAQPAAAADIAAKLAELPARAEEGTRFGVHLCLGDMNHEAYRGGLATARPLVLLANEVARRWPAGRTLEFLHAPFAAAAEPPTFDPGFYEPLRDLDLPAATRFAAGFVHERVDVDRSRELLALIEAGTGRRVDLSAACGLGRRPDPAQAWDAMDKARALVDG